MLRRALSISTPGKWVDRLAKIEGNEKLWYRIEAKQNLHIICIYFLRYYSVSQAQCHLQLLYKIIMVEKDYFLLTLDYISGLLYCFFFFFVHEQQVL